MKLTLFAAIFTLLTHKCISFVPFVRVHTSINIIRTPTLFSATTDDKIISPFENPTEEMEENDDDYELPLTRDNVEKVLDEMRPYLQSDGYI